MNKKTNEKNLIDLLFNSTNTDSQLKPKYEKKYIRSTDKESYAVFKFNADLVDEKLPQIYKEFYDFFISRNLESYCFFVIDLTAVQKIDYKGIIFLVSLTKAFSKKALIDFLIKDEQKILNIFSSIDYFSKFEIKNKFEF